MKRGNVLLAIVAAVVLAVVVATVWRQYSGNGGSPSASSGLSATSPSVPQAPKPVATPEASSAEDIMRDGLAVAFTWYPRTDKGQSEAFARARAWFSDALAGRFDREAHARPAPGLQWQQWTADGTEILADVAVGCSGCPPDSASVVHRVATIHQTAVTGERAAPIYPDTVVWVTAIKSDQRWVIDTITF